MLAPEPPFDLLFAFVPYLCSVLYFVVLYESIKTISYSDPSLKSVGKGIGTVLVL